MEMNSKSSTNQSTTWPTIAAFIIVILIIGVFAGIIYVSITEPTINLPYTEIILGLVIIFGASVLILLLFIMATVFNRLGLNDNDEALGLPKGTVRAMMALLLIIVWVIASIFLFINIPTLASMVSTPASTTAAAANATATSAGATAIVANANSTATTGSNTTAITANATATAASTTAANANAASTAAMTAVTDSTRLAEEFYATMSTLVVAVIGFYFGSKVNAPQGTAPSTPSISSVAPNTGAPGQTFTSFTIMGNNFTKSPDRVRLVSDNNLIEGTNVQLVSTEQITCTIILGANQALGYYDVIVSIASTEYKLPQAFQVITAPSTTAPPTGTA
jgi:IPT/TIG domain